MAQPSKATPFQRDAFVAAILQTEIAVIESAAETMTDRIFAAAHGVPLTGTIEQRPSASFTEKSLGAVVLMAGYASDRQAADALAGRIWRALNGLPEATTPAAAPAAPQGRTPPTTSTAGLPQEERVLNPDVIADRTVDYSSGAHMLQVMASRALSNIQKGIRGKIVHDFKYRNHRMTIRVTANLQQATISIYSPGKKEPLFRTLSTNELWAYARARDRSAIEQIARGMVTNADMRKIESGHGSESYAKGIADTDTDAEGRPTSVPADEPDPDIDNVSEAEDREPTMRELMADARRRQNRQ